MTAAILAVHIILILFYGMQKIAFHEDEYYTYYTSAGYLGINPYGEIQETTGMQLLSHFVVLEQNRFDFSNVVDIETIDVHPPLYYLTLHFLMSCFPNQFYKWFGILLNGCYSVVSCVGIIFFIYQMDKSRYREFLALTAGLLYAVHPAMISNVMLTRMYSMSVMWTVLYIDVFVLLMKNYLCRRGKFVLFTMGGAFVCYCAFLTHYFCLYIPFFLTLGFCVYAVIRKLFYKEKCLLRMLIYGFSLLAAIGLAILSFPVSLYQIFKGVDGTTAFNTLLHTDLFTMFKLFLPIINKNFFAGMMYPILGVLVLALIVGAVLLKIRKKEKLDPAANFAIPGIGLAVGFITVWLLSKTALFVGDDASRYFYTAAVLMLPLIAYVICKATLYGKDILLPAKAEKVLLPILTLIVLFPALMGHLQGNVLYLYRDRQEALEFARENASYPCVMIYDQENRFKTWYTSNEIWPYEKVIFIRQQDGEETIPKSESLKEAEKLIVYMDGPEELLDLLVEHNDHLKSWSLLRHDPYFYVYVLE